MKTLTLALFLALTCACGFAQNRQVTDSLKHELRIAKHDTTRALLLTALCDEYRSTDSAQFFGQQALALAQKINFPKAEVRALTTYSRVFYEWSNTPKALQMQLNALKIAEEHHLEEESAWTLNQIGNLYGYLNDFQKSLSYYKQSLAIFQKYHNEKFIAQEKMQIGRVFGNLNQLDSAMYYEMQAYTEMMQRSKNGDINPLVYRNLAAIHSKLGNDSLAIEYGRKALHVASKTNFRFVIAVACTDMGRYFKKMHQIDSSIHYAKLGLAKAQLTLRQQTILEASTLLSELYEPIDTKEALRYFKIATAARDKLFGIGNIQAIQEMVAQDKERKKEAENERKAYANKLKLYAALTALTMFLIVSFILYRNNRQKQKANRVLEKTLIELRSTQAQLIQKEKLASLGELTAGIAHEIQNPLNFVNNFSELSVDLAQELNEELDKEPIDKAFVKELMGDLTQNQAKINHHGKRASSIVSGMLEHSRTSTGERALTDINKLADEYLRLSYHGMRAKDNSFNADYELIADENLPKIEVIPQDIGRVLLNLINNAFWACTERSGWRPSRSHQNHRSDYLPKVTISTRWLSVAEARSEVEIRVTDNGIGITDEVKAKIFQPFFTTKPTGQGTGLGLSLAYDIVTKGHGGTLTVKSTEGIGSEFIITLPIQTI